MNIIKDEAIIYSREFAKGINQKDFISLLPDLFGDAYSKTGGDLNCYDFYKFKVSYIVERELKLLFIFISDLSDDFDRIKVELVRIKEEFLNLFKDNLTSEIENSLLSLLDPTTDKIHRNLKPKISLVGFSGVGKTTITQLIKASELPIEHIPTITGDVATVKIGRLYFLVWDFAGQEQFSFLWNKFIKGSDAVLIISDSTLENIEKSKFFLELIGEEAPYAHTAVIGNKQDLPNSLNVEDIERIIGVKTYSMIAIDPNNREKMIKIIADILDMNATVSPLLKPIVERDLLINEAQTALQIGELKLAASHFEKIANLCIEIGDDSLVKEFYLKSEKLYQYVN